MEWLNPYNSFNSIKGLTYFENYRLINEWRLGNILTPPPPLEISIDPIGACSLHCQHCNFGKYLKDREIERLDDIHYLNLIKFFADWGSKALCHGGGGSPTLHTKLWDALLYAKFLGLENSIATNGINFNDETIDIAIKTCRWIGVSVDASNSNTYKIGRRADYFDKVLENIKKLAKRTKELNKNCDIAFKFLVFSYNMNEIYDACKLAKSLGVPTFHARLADYRHQGMDEFEKKNKMYDIELINRQFNECHTLEDKDFHVYTVTHKFNNDFTPKRNFSQCFASPICIQICPDGNIYLCPDTRKLEYYKLGSHYPDVNEIKKVWGSKKHHDLVFNSGCSNCQSRCTFNPYNKQFEELFINNEDPLCRNFV